MKPKFTKNLFTNLLNLIGLTVAFASFVVILIQVNYELGYNKGFKEYDSIYRVELTYDPNEFDVYTPYLSRPMGLFLAQAVPEVEIITQFQDLNGSLSDVGSDEIEGYVKSASTAADKSVFALLGIELTQGDTTHFDVDGNVVISESFSKVLFPSGDPVGKSFKIRNGSSLSVIGVYNDFPANSFLGRTDFIYTIGHRFDNDYGEWSFPLYMKIDNEEMIGKVSTTLINQILTLFRLDRKDYEERGLDINKMIRLSKIEDTHFSTDVRYDFVEKGNKQTTYSLLVVAILIILIAIINFVNFSMASVPLRMKDINTRKVLGSTNIALQMRQIVAAVVISILSYIVALAVVNSLSGSFLNSLISGSLTIADNLSIILLGFGISVITGVVAGIYPAIYSTSFAPALVLKGSFSLSPKGRVLRGGLIAFQYVISFVLIIVALFINIQTKYMKNFDMGFVDDNILSFYNSRSVAQKRDVFAQKLKENTMIEDVTFARDPLVSNGKMGWGRTYKGESINVDTYPVATNFLDFFGMSVVEGRNFTKDDDNKQNGTFIFNETAVKTFGFDLNDKLVGHNEPMADIVGVVKDFNFQPLQYGINPFAFYIFGSEPWWPLTYTFVKVSPNANIQEAKEFIISVISEMGDRTYTLSDIPIDFMDEVTGQLYAKEDALGKLILIFCLLSVLISIIGILGLIYFETQFKRKEIGVRRVFGSSAEEILAMLNRAYLKIMCISFVVSVPIAIVVIKLWLKNFTYQSPIPVWIFAAAFFAVLIITIIVITLRSLRAANENPVNSIKTE